MDYANIVSQFRPLDLIVFNGNDPISKVITKLEEAFTGDGTWSHVGLLVNNKLLPGVEELEEGEFYVWESTISGNIPFTDGVFQIEDNKGKFGVQIRSLPAVIDAYNEMGGQVGYSRLKDNPWENTHKRKQLIDVFRRIHKKYHNATYDYNPVNLFSSIIPCMRPMRNLLFSVDYINKLEIEYATIGFNATVIHNSYTIDIKDEDIELLFCSEMVAKFYVLAGILDIKYRPDNVLPVDFFSGRDSDGMPAICEIPVQLYIDYSMSEGDEGSTEGGMEINAV